MFIVLIPLYVVHLVTKLPSSCSSCAVSVWRYRTCPLLHCPFTIIPYLKFLQNKRLTAVVLLAAFIYRSVAVMKEI